jgi:mannose-6-phosphate isomerase-like protein (cupin superfamily)
MYPGVRDPRCTLVLFLGALLAAACAPRGPIPDHAAVLSASTSPGMGVVLAESEGERRFRRPQEGPQRRAVTAPIILKVDGANGGSTQLFMGYEDVPPGESIQRHYHPHADEILFIHRGRGVASLGDHQAAFDAGTTIYIPHGTRVSLRNTGTEPVSVAFIFADPTMSDWFRDGTVAEGQPAPVLTPAEVAARRARHHEHIVIEP